MKSLMYSAFIITIHMKIYDQMILQESLFFAKNE